MRCLALRRNNAVVLKKIKYRAKMQLPDHRTGNAVAVTLRVAFLTRCLLQGRRSSHTSLTVISTRFVWESCSGGFANSGTSWALLPLHPTLETWFLIVDIFVISFQISIKSRVSVLWVSSSPDPFSINSS
jgi:hypothetical protein